MQPGPMQQSGGADARQGLIDARAAALRSRVEELAMASFKEKDQSYAGSELALGASSMAWPRACPSLRMLL